MNKQQELSAAGWDARYLNDNTPWDMGQVSPPLKAVIDQLTDKQTRILIPGAGRAYEAVYLHQQGFTEVYVCDWAAHAFSYLRENAPDFPEHHLLIQDFFTLDLAVDLILEQTFFCAIDPALRQAYVKKCADILAPGGTLAGVLFAHQFDFAGPPFGGTQEEYKTLFSEKFHIEELHLCAQSIKPRAGRELFIRCMKQ